MLPDTALPASLTALHFALGIFRRHRSQGRRVASPFVLPSFLFTLVPWFWPTPVGLAAGVGAHIVWLLFCEQVAPSVKRPGGTASFHVSSEAPTNKPAPVGMTPTVPAGFVATPVLAVIDEATDIKTFRLSRPQGFEFLPGQFVPVRVQIDGRPHVRCYSISSPPHARGYLEISVRRQGLVSGALHGTLRAGATLAINRPAGAFTYPSGDDRPLALIAGGIGITPLLSMIRHAVAADPTRPVTLLYSVRGEEHLAFRHELRLLVERHPNVRVAVTLSEAGESSRFRSGHIDVAMVRQHVPSASDTLFYLCGPQPMLTAMTALLEGLGVPAPQIRFEQFALAVAASMVNEAEHRPETTTPVGAHFAVTFANSGRTVTASPNQTLLETAEAHGVPLPSVCRSGVCLTCRARLTSGAADCRSDVLDPGDRADGYVLPCVTWPTSDCTLEA